MQSGTLYHPNHRQRVIRIGSDPDPLVIEVVLFLIQNQRFLADFLLFEVQLDPLRTAQLLPRKQSDVQMQDNFYLVLPEYFCLIEVDFVVLVRNGRPVELLLQFIEIGVEPVQRVVCCQLAVGALYGNFCFFDSGVIDITVIKWNNSGELFLVNVYVVDPAGEGHIRELEMAEVGADVAEPPLPPASYYLFL